MQPWLGAASEGVALRRSFAGAFPHYGAFGDESAAWANDVSGVMVLHDSDTLLQWLPNPFAADAIADPRLLDMGFPFEMLGASSPSELAAC